MDVALLVRSHWVVALDAQHAQIMGTSNKLAGSKDMSESTKGGGGEMPSKRNK